MKNKFTIFIISFVIIGIIGVLIIFSMIAVEEIKKQLEIETGTQPSWEDNSEQIANQDKTIENNIEVPRNYRKSVR